MNWIFHHAPTLLIFVGGAIATVGAYMSERAVSTRTESKRKGRWPIFILVGAVMGVIGTYWAGYEQDKLSDYLSGGDSWGYLQPTLVTTDRISYAFIQSGQFPVYDVFADVHDVTQMQHAMREKGLNPIGAYSWDGAVAQDTFLNIYKQGETSLTIGNVAPGQMRMAWDGPAPKTEDQEYSVSIWSRNGYVTETILLHKVEKGWASAVKVWRTAQRSQNGIPDKTPLYEFVGANFPKNEITWK